MIHYVYSTRGGYLYLVGKHNTEPKVENSTDFVLSVPDKTSQTQIDTLAHRRFMEHLKRPRKVVHDRHKHETTHQAKHGSKSDRVLAHV